MAPKTGGDTECCLVSSTDNDCGSEYYDSDSERRPPPAQSVREAVQREWCDRQAILDYHRSKYNELRREYTYYHGHLCMTDWETGPECTQYLQADECCGWRHYHRGAHAVVVEWPYDEVMH